MNGKSIRFKAVVVLAFGAIGLLADPAPAQAAKLGFCANNCQYLVNGCEGGVGGTWCAFWQCTNSWACDVGNCEYPERRIRCCDDQGGCLEE